jgi:hypothetical protein
MKCALLVPIVWSFCCALLPAAEPKVLFQDAFKEKLDKQWKWIREEPKSWRIKDDALEIRVQPGVADTVKNALVRPAPDRRKGRYAIEVTVTNLTPPSQQYEQAGITWYNKGKPVFKLVKELIDGKTWIIPGRKPMETKSVQLRLVVTAEGWIAQYRPEDKKEFLTAAEGKLPLPDEEQVSIQCYNGPPEAEHWIRFDDFRIVRLPE